MDVPDDLLRPGVEVAFVVAVIGARQRPPIPPPPALRPFLQFQKLPTAALAPVRKVVEEDAEFRARVAPVATDETVNRASWLWLHRPDGWEDELAELVDEAADSGTDGKATKALQRKAEAAEAKARRHAAELAALRAGLERAQDARQRAEADAAKAVTRLEELERAAARARARAERAGEELDAARAESAELAEQLAEARAEIDALRERLAERGQVEAVAHVAAAEEQAAGAAVAEAAAAEPAAPSPNAASTWPAAALDALGGAAAAASALAASLQELAGSFSSGDGRVSDRATPPSPAPPPPRAVSRPAEPVNGRMPRRRALRIPRGMHVGTEEADAWLLTEAEAAVVVDGYNVAKLGWPDAVLADQRERLLDVLDDLANRYHTTVEVVFDGADVGPIRSARRRRVAVRFSPPQVLADDVIRELVASYPPTDPIVVVTNDRAVAHDVRAAGANVVTSDGLLAIARR